MSTVRAERYTWWRSLRSSTLSPTARHVALTIATYMNKDGGGAWPSLATLADDTGRGRRTVARAVKELTEAGYLDVSRGGGRRDDGGYVSNRYVATAPVSSVMGDTDSGMNGDTGDTDGEAPPTPFDDLSTVSSQPGGVSSQHGAVPSETGSGVTHGTRSTHELAIQEPNHHAATKSPAPDGAKKKFELGKRYAGHVATGAFTEDDVATLIQQMDDTERTQFLQGYKEGAAA